MVVFNQFCLRTRCANWAACFCGCSGQCNLPATRNKPSLLQMSPLDFSNSENQREKARKRETMQQFARGRGRGRGKGTNRGGRKLFGTNVLAVLALSKFISVSGVCDRMHRVQWMRIWAGVYKVDVGEMLQYCQHQVRYQEKEAAKEPGMDTLGRKRGPKEAKEEFK